MEAGQGLGPPGLEEVDFEIGINNEVIDEILFDQNHAEKLSGNYLPEDEYVPERDPEEVEHEEYGGGIVMKMVRRQIIILLHSRIVSLQTLMTTRIAQMMIVGIS